MLARLLLLAALVTPIACVAPSVSDAEPVEPIGTTSDALKVCASGAVVRGVDVSAWQGTISWSKVKADGRVFAFARVSDGTKYPDSKFAANWPAMKSVGLVRGSYQFFRPSQDPTAQAKLLLARIGTLGPNDLPPVIDVESSDGMSASTVISRVKTWLAVVEKGTGRKPIIYTASGFWSSLGSPSFAGYPLWVANWGVSCPNLPGGWKDWKFWQYSDSGSVSGISGGVDVNQFNGSLAELKDYAGGPDADGDGVPDATDNCDTVKNTDQKDTDKDGKGDACDTDDDNDGVLDTKDNCDLIKNVDQKDTDKDGKGDACDADDDNDGILDTKDNCPLVANKNQADTDKDGKGDLCDDDIDGDGVLNVVDNCKLVKNADQKDTNGDGVGDACATDDDKDGVPDAVDNCPKLPNEDQADTDKDGLGDACDPDDDNDGVLDTTDNCDLTANPDQKDSDGNGKGDACDVDKDGDGIIDDEDNCPSVKNPDQKDFDEDGAGDVCDDDIDNDGVANATDNCPDVPNGDQADSDKNGKGDACDDAPGADPSGDDARGGAKGDSDEMSGSCSVRGTPRKTIGATGALVAVLAAGLALRRRRR